MKTERYRDAVLVALGAREIKVSDLQHRLRIGYEEANTYIDKMEEDRVIEPSDGTPVRQLLISDIQQFDERQ